MASDEREKKDDKSKKKKGAEPAEEPRPAVRKAEGAGGMAFERPIQELEAQLQELEELSQRTNLDISSEVEALRKRLHAAIETTYADLTPWDRVSVARHPDRPVASDYISTILDDFIELHGDRVFGDDRAIVSGLARIGERRSC